MTRGSILKLQNMIPTLVAIKPESKNNDKTKVYKGVPVYHLLRAQHQVSSSARTEYLCQISIKDEMMELCLCGYFRMNSWFHNHIGECTNGCSSRICYKLYNDDFKPGNLMNNSHVCVFLPMTVFKNIYLFIMGLD